MTSWSVARPGAPRRVLLARFLLLGALLFAGRWLIAPARDARPPLVVDVAAGADADAVRRAAVDAALVDEALRAGWPLADPVVRDRVRDAARAAAGGGDGDGDGVGELDEALARNLAAIDPVVRARLAWIGRELVRTRTPTRAPTPAELAAYRRAHPARYDPPWLSFRQRVVTSDRHGVGADAAARALVAELAGAGPDAAGGDPSLLPARMSGTPAMIDARFGVGFAARVAAAPLERWSGPVAGTFGAHVVWREAARAPDDIAASEAVAARVARDWAHDRHAEDVRQTIDRLVARRGVVMRRVHELREVAP